MCRRMSVVLAATVGLAVAACQNDVSSPATGGPRSSTVAADAQGQVPARGIEAEFEAYQRRVPGFAGAFVDEDGTVVVKLKDVTQGNVARALLGGFALEHGGGKGKRPSGDIRIEPAQFDFMELSTWRDRIRPLFSIGGMVALDVDERANRVWVGVTAEGMRGLIMSKAEEMGVPPSALVVEVTEAATQLALLTDSIRPSPGGVQVSTQTYGTTHICTLGFNAYSQYYGFGFVTNSHCTPTMGLVENTPFGQPSWDSPTIGLEYADPYYWQGGSCPAQKKCRNSDAAFVQYSDGSFGQFGYIARPDTVCSNGCAGTLHISNTRPRLTITGTTSYPSSGETLDKVGISSGWTDGRIMRTCIDVEPVGTDRHYYCQAQVAGYAQEGDSGSPVFKNYDWPNGNSARLYGLLFGGNGLNGSSAWFVFSPLGNVVGELGGLTVY